MGVCLGLFDPDVQQGGADGTEMLDADVVMLQCMLDSLAEELLACNHHGRLCKAGKIGQPTKGK